MTAPMIVIQNLHLICSSTRGTNASGIINGVLQSADGKLTRYTETVYYTKSENETETGSAQVRLF